jgi:hypothetical protein
VTIYCEFCNEFLDPVSGVEFLDQFNDCKLFKENSDRMVAWLIRLAESGGEVSKCYQHLTDIVVG